MIIKKLIESYNLKQHFKDRGYNCLEPYKVVNNKDTVFVSAGIQPILADVREHKINDNKKIYLSQPVIRTQFADSVAEGSSIAFINSTTAGFNISEEEHNILVNDWIELFYELGMHPNDIESKTKEYSRKWGDLLVSGKKTFYYYKDLELGDTTFFTNVTKEGKDIGIETMSDVGFGLERIRWSVNGQSYFDLYSSSSHIAPEIKACLSVLALLLVNDVTPSNKNSGYRARMFSKKLVNLLNGMEMDKNLEIYLKECIRYWKDWQEVNKDIDISVIENEYIRNCNRFLIDKFTNEGYQNLSGININISREEFKKRLLCAGVNPDKILELGK